MAYTDYNIKDDNGNDNYSISHLNRNSSTIVDKKGSDKYTFSDISYIEENASTTVTDSEGNDRYTINNSKKITINESLGNDEYTLNSADNIILKDNGGKDKYTVSYSDVIISDAAGKDDYKFSYADRFYVTDGIQNDTKGGNDTYSIKHSYGNYVFSQTNPSPEANIVDYYGKENYSISYSDDVAVEEFQGSDSDKIKYSSGADIKDKDNTSTLSSNDKYEVIESKNSYITDYSGNDNYTLTSSNGTIIDEQGNDSYNVKEVPVRISRTSITDKKGNDKYNFTNTYAEVTDNLGKDKYTISNSDVKITDKGIDNDTYTVKKLNSKVVINDLHGVDDKLNLSSASKSNLVYMANYDLSTTSNYSDVKDGSLYIFDRTKSGFVKIENFLNTNGGNITSGKAEGYIENIKAGLFSINNAIDNYTLSSSSVSALGQAVAEWQSNSNLSTNYGSIDAILNSENANDVAKFIAFVQNK